MELRSLLCTNVSVFSSRSFSASSLIHPTSYGNHLKVSMEQKTPDQDTISNGYRQRSVFEVVEKECLMMPPIRCCETLGVWRCLPVTVSESSCHRELVPPAPPCVTWPSDYSTSSNPASHGIAGDKRHSSSACKKTPSNSSCKSNTTSRKSLLTEDRRCIFHILEILTFLKCRHYIDLAILAILL